MAKNYARVNKKQAEKIANLQYYEIRNMSKDQIEEVLRMGRKNFDISKAQMGRAYARSRFFYSPAYESAEKNITDRDISAMSRQDMIKEVIALRDFYSSKTYNVSGARKVMKDQDIRIFGEKEDWHGIGTGKPNKKMDRSTREMFWSVYNEFSKGIDTAALAARNYARIQQALGEVIIERASRNLTMGQLRDKLKSILEEIEAVEEGRIKEEDASKYARAFAMSGDDIDWLFS